MERVKVDPKPDTILPLKGAHRQVALECIIGSTERFIGEGGLSWLKDSERRKVIKEVDKIIAQLERKKEKICK